MARTPLNRFVIVAVLSTLMRFNSSYLASFRMPAILKTANTG